MVKISFFCHGVLLMGAAAGPGRILNDAFSAGNFQNLPGHARARSEARKTMPAAISAGSPRRCITLLPPSTLISFR